MALSLPQRIIVSAIIAVIVASLMRYVIYNYTGWQSFTMKKGENFQINNLDPSLVSKLKFRDCIFTVKGTDGTTKTFNISHVLNNMVAAYEGNTKQEYKFKLDDPGLSIYSFNLPGFNDNTVHPEPRNNWLDSDANTSATLTGYYKLLN